MNESIGSWVAGLVGLSFPVAVLTGTVLGSPGLALLVLLGMWAVAYAAGAA